MTRRKWTPTLTRDMYIRVSSPPPPDPIVFGPPVTPARYQWQPLASSWCPEHAVRWYGDDPCWLCEETP